MASLGAPGGCAQQGHESQAEADHCIRVGPSLGGLARTARGSRAAEGGLGGNSSKKCVVREWWSFFIPKNTTMGGLLCTFPIWNTFQALRASLYFLFLVAIK